MTKSKKTGIITISLLLSAVIFFCLMIFIDGMTVPDRESWKEVYTARTDISKGTYITDDNVDTLFGVEKVPDEFYAESAVTDKKSLTGNSTTRNIRSREIITNDKITYLAEMEYADKRLEDCAEVSVGFESLNSSLAGKIRGGDIISIEIVTNEKATKCLAENVYVSHVYDNTGVEIIDDGGENAASVMTVLISNKDRNSFIRGLASGKAYISKVLDTNNIRNDSIVYDITG